MEWIDRWAYAGNVKINYLESHDHDERLMPLQYVSGVLNDAEQSLDVLDAFYARKRVAVSLRGRGKSEAPKSGCSLEDHASDIEAAFKASGLAEYCLKAHSFGVPYAIRFAARHPGVERLIIGDYLAKYPAIPKSWAERIAERLYKAGKERIVVRGIQKESQQIDIFEELAAIKISVLVIRGTLKDVILKDADVEHYKQSLQQLKITENEGAGHEYLENGRESFLKSTNEF